MIHIWKQCSLKPALEWGGKKKKKKKKKRGVLVAGTDEATDLVVNKFIYIHIKKASMGNIMLHWNSAFFQVY
jgi:hypothetical protein